MQTFVKHFAYMWLKLLELFIIILGVVADENNNSTEKTLTRGTSNHCSSQTLSLFYGIQKYIAQRPLRKLQNVEE